MSKQLRREGLKAWAETLDAVNAPYSSQVQAENHFFVSQLQKRKGTELAEIRQKAQEDSSKSQKESKKWTRFGWGTIATGVGVSIFSSGTVGMVALAGGLAGMLYGGSRSTKEQQNAAEGEHFVIQLDDVAESIERDSRPVEQPVMEDLVE